MKRLGIPLLPDTLPPVQGGPNEPGFGWRLSDQARQQIESIEKHIITRPAVTRRVPHFRF